MKIYKKIIIDKNNNVIFEDSYDYKGPIGIAQGIHYSFKNEKPRKAMEKQAKREKKLAERKAKKQEKLGNKQKEEPANKIDVDIPLTLEAITSPNKDK